MILKENSTKKFYYPYCKEKPCDGILKIQINDNFTIDYECDKNEAHKGKNIYFKTFELFYLKEKDISKCSKCNLELENDYHYICKKCDGIYCPNCILFEKHIKDDIKNLIIDNKKCKIHHKELSRYCINCKQNLCNYCIKFDNNPHEDHVIKNLYTFMPSTQKIRDLNQKIKNKSLYYDKIIYSLNIWQREFNNKIEELKKNLIKEIDFYKKMTSNFNPFFLNYTYYWNFYYLNNHIKKENNFYFDEFIESSNSVEKGNALIKLLFKRKKEDFPSLKKTDSFCSSDKVYDYKIEDNYYLKWIKNENKIKLYHYDEKNKETNKICELGDISIDDIYSVSSSPKKNQIYICLKREKKVLIYEYNLIDKYLRNSNNVIEEDIEDAYFNKCISITDDYLATADFTKINIWCKDINSENGYLNIKNIEFGKEISDLLLINNDFFISSIPSIKAIVFFEINSLEEKKRILNIDSVNYKNILYLYKEYTLVNCSEGISIISNKAKELIQYIELEYDSKKLCLNYKDNIFFIIVEDKLYHNSFYDMKINVYKEKEGSFVEYREYKIKEIENSFRSSSTFQNNRIECICFCDKFFLVSGEKEYFLIEDEEETEKLFMDENSFGSENE